MKIIRNLFRTALVAVIASLPSISGKAQTDRSLQIDQAVELRFKTEGGKTYTLQGSNDFSSWTTIGKAEFGNGRVQKRFLSVDDPSENLQFFRLEVADDAGSGFAPVGLVGFRYILNTGGFPDTLDFKEGGVAVRTGAAGLSTVGFLYEKSGENTAMIELTTDERREVYQLEYTGEAAGAFRLETYTGDQLDDVDVGTFTVQAAMTMPPVPGGAQMPPLPPVVQPGVAKSELSGLSFVFHDGGEPIWLQFEDSTQGRAIDDDEATGFSYVLEPVNEAEQIVRIEFGEGLQFELHLAYSGECSGTYILRETEGGQLDDVDMGTFSVSTEPIGAVHGEDDDEEYPHGEGDDEEYPFGEDDDEEHPFGEDDDEEHPHGEGDDEEYPFGEGDDEEHPFGEDDDDEYPHGGSDDEEHPFGDDDDDEYPHGDDDDDEYPFGDDDDDEYPHGGSDDDEYPHENDENEEPMDDRDEGTFDVELGEGNNDAEPGMDVYPVLAVLSGTVHSEKLQGYESNDTVTGGGGADLFPFTTGNDVITDFNPAEDMIDVGDFARESDGFGVLTSLEAIANHSTQTTDENGRPSLVIDVDGAEGDSTTTLVGITIAELNESNVYFGLDGESIPPLEFTHIAEFLVTSSNGDVVLFPAHDLSNHPIEGQLISKGVGN